MSDTVETRADLINVQAHSGEKALICLCIQYMQYE